MESRDALLDYYQTLKPRNLAPLWEVLGALVTPEPARSMDPALWRYHEVREDVLRAGSLITAEKAERRVLILENPAAIGQSRITSTLYAGLQLILPGEIAPCHRHSQSALRFVMEGEGAFTALDGRRVIMRQWDLVLTPNWVWHDHGNESDRPMVWLDGLDIPLISALNASFAEQMPGAHARSNGPAAASGVAVNRYRRMVDQPDEPSEERCFHYPYAEWRQALADAVAADDLDECHGYRLEFLNRDGALMETISAFCQIIPAGMATRPLRSSDGLIHVVVEGRGSARIDDVDFTLASGDIFVVPHWRKRSFAADSELVLFSYSDKTVQSKLGLWRSAAC